MVAVSKLIVLEVGEGDFDRGFAVVLRIGETGKPHRVEFRGHFPPVPEIPQLFDRWQSAYYRWGENHSWGRILEPDLPSQTIDLSDWDDCYHTAEQLKAGLHNWFDQSQMRDLKERILENVRQEQPARLILQTQVPVLRKLPWHLWQLLERRPQLEIAISDDPYLQMYQQSSNPVKIFGLSAPRIFKQFQYINRQDLFFLSAYISKMGSIEISERERETVHVWIDNKPDNIPLIVMRETVPAPVKDTFFKYFLETFFKGESLYLSVRKAREQLQSFEIESRYPCASWLPVICQNPAALELKCRQRKRKKPESKWSQWNLNVFMVISLCLYFGLQVNLVNKQQARQQIQKAEQQIQEVQEMIKLEQQGNKALQQFESQELEALLEAMDAGQGLKKLVQDERRLEKYPTVRPILALQTILDNIRERNQLTENQGSFSSANLSPDGTRIVTTSSNNAPKIWNISGQILTQLKEKKVSTTSASFSPNGTQIITISTHYNEPPKIWDTFGRLLAELKGDKTSTKSVDFRAESASFSTDGTRVFTTSYNGTFKIWNTSGKLLAEIKIDEDKETLASRPGASFSSDGTRVITLSKDGNLVKVWATSGKLIKEYPVAATSASFSPNGNLIITFSSDRTVKIWNTEGFPIAELRSDRDAFKSATFSPNGQFILLFPYRYYSKAKIWKIDRTRHYSIYDEALVSLNRIGIETASFSQNGNRLVTISSSGSNFGSNNVVNIWDLSERPFSNIKSLPLNEFDYVIASPNGQHILTSAPDLYLLGKTASVWDLSSKLIVEIKGDPNIFQPIFSPDGKHIFTPSAREKDETIRVWNLSGELIAKFKGRRAVFNPDGSRILIILEEQRKAQLWDLSGRLLTEIKDYYANINNAIFSSDGQHIITWNGSTTVLIWNSSGKLIATIDYDNQLKQLLLKNKQVDLRKLDKLLPPSFIPDGKQILTVTYDNTLRLWDLSGKLLTEKTHQDRIKEFSFSPDGKYVLIIFHTGKAQIWDWSGRQFTDFKGYPGVIVQPSFSPDGQRILTVSNDKIVRLWDLSGRLLAELKIPYKNPFLLDKGLKSTFFSQDGKQIIVVSGDGIIRTWRVEGLDELLARGCDWLKDYLATHPEARERLKVCQQKA